ncbi:hypothetical protein DB30_05100 [Enhygromyxa salina]|uniref:Uncharacterized protein n=1 Tax=Enhygromyxa salina TaxID=215803 RepID=A0A0C1ZE24_9BACT|nr:hypothetical protein DB30_05100 [Enhygromyxa salina]
MIASVPHDARKIWGKEAIVVCREAFNKSHKTKGGGSKLDGQAMTLDSQACNNSCDRTNAC